MSITSSRVDKGTTRFAPTLKARPTRRANTAASTSEESTPTPTPPSTVDPSAASSSTFSSVASFENQNNGSTPTTATATPAGTPMITPSSKFAPPPPPYTSSSTSASPIVSLTSPRIGPKSPTFSAARPKDKIPSIGSSSYTSSTTTVSTSAAASSSLSTSVSSLSLSTSSAAETLIALASSSPHPSLATSINASGINNNKKSATAIDTPTSGNARRTSTSTAKQGSLISVPTSRPRHSISGDQNEVNGGASSASSSTAGTSGGSASKRRASVQKSSDRGSKRAARRKEVTDETIEQEDVEEVPGEGTAAGEGEEGIVDGEDEDFEPDYSNTPMFEFVRDMGSGKRSSTYMEKERLWEQQRERDREARRRREAGLEDPQDNKGRFTKEPTPKPQVTKSFGPKVRVVDGKMVLDEESLHIDHADLEQAPDDGPMEYVEESASTTYINSSSYSSKHRAEKWTPKETELFYQALSQWGTDFGIIQKMFPSKSRIAVRNKFKREDRINKARVEAALTNKTPIDLEQYSQMSATTFSDMTEEELMSNIQKEEEEKVKQLIKSEEDHLRESEGGGQDLELEPELEPEEEIVEEIVGEI